MQDSTNLNQKLVGTQLECIQTQNQVTITEHAEDFWTGTERFEGFRVTYPDGMTHIISCDRVGKDYLPHTWVLADTFGDVEPHCLDIPLEVYELDPCIGFTPCPDCEGQGWIETEGSAWYNRAWALHTFVSMKPCTTCNCEGVVLEALEPIQDEEVPVFPLVHTTSQTWLMAA